MQKWISAKYQYSHRRQGISLTSSDYIMEVLLDRKPACVLAIAPINRGFWVLGDIFLRRYYTVFDATEKRIGLAKAK